MAKQGNNRDDDTMSGGFYADTSGNVDGIDNMGLNTNGMGSGQYGNRDDSLEDAGISSDTMRAGSSSGIGRSDLGDDFDEDDM
jgi:hypothetical protein